VQQGARLNVQVELVDVETGMQLWGQQYEHELADLLTVQNNLAAEISQALRLELSGAEQTRIVARTTDSQAYQAYLRGRFHWRQRTNQDFKKAIEFFDEAREKDPGYALAYAGLADSYFLLGAQYYGADEDYPPADAIAQARASALEALRLSDDLAGPHATLGFIRFAYDMDWDGAELDFLAAIERDPDYATARQWYGLYLSVMGRHDEAIEQSRRAVDLAPTSALQNRGLARSYVNAGKYKEGMKQLETARQLAPEFSLTREMLIEAYWVSGEKEKAVDAAEAFDPDLGNVFRLASEERFEEARDALASAPARFRSLRFIVNHLVVEDRDAFFEALEASIDSRDAQAALVFISPMINSIGSDPRMIAIRQRIGLDP